MLREDFPNSFWDTESLFGEYLNSGSVTALLNQELAALATNPKHEIRRNGRRLSLGAGEYCELRLDLVVGDSLYVHTAPYRAFFAPLGPNSLHYDQYRLPATYRNDTFDSSTRLEPGIPGSISPCKYLKVLGDKFAYDIRIQRETLVLKLMTTAIDSLEWLFHKDTRMAYLANDSDIEVTHLRAIVDYLAHMGDEYSVEVLAGLAEHPNHTLRWSVVRTLCRLNPATGIGVLEVAQNDVHPHVRAAARSTLLNLENDVPR